MNSTTFLTPIALTFVAATSAAAQNVFEVGGGSSLPLASAVALATDGDIILLRPGVYGRVGSTAVLADGSVAATQNTILIEDKSIAIVGDGNGPAVIEGNLWITGSDPDTDVLLRNISFETSVIDPNLSSVTGPSPPMNINASNNAGRLWIESCTFRANPQAGATQLAHAITLGGGGSTSITRCTVEGADGSPTIPFAYGGVRIADQRVAIFDSTIDGGVGLTPSGPNVTPGGNGGNGVELEGGELMLSSASIGGGDGGSAFCTAICTLAGAGGDGLVLTPPQPSSGLTNTCRSVAAALTGGQAGALGLTPPGGVGLVDPGGAFQAIATTPRRSLLANPLVTSGAPIDVSLAGLPNENVALYANGVQGWAAFTTIVPAFVIPFAGAVSSPLVWGGTLDGVGAGTTSGLSYTLPPGWAGRALYFQPMMIDAGPFQFVTMGAPTSIVVVDSSIAL